MEPIRPSEIIYFVSLFFVFWYMPVILMRYFVKQDIPGYMFIVNSMAITYVLVFRGLL